MPVEFRLPDALRDVTGGAGIVAAEGVTLAAAIDDLGTRFPGLPERLLDDGGLRRLVNIYVGSVDVRYGDGLGTALADGDVVTILPAWATAAG